MPPITASTGDKFQVTVRGQLENQLTENVLYFAAATPVDDVELRLIQALVECFITNLVPVWPIRMKLTEVRWKMVNPTLGVEHIFVIADNNVGQAAIDSLPSFNSVVVSKRTALGGRSHRGRMFLPAIPESATSGSSITDSSEYWAAILAFLTCVATKFILGDPPGANSFQIMNYSRKLGGQTFPLGNAGFQAITELTATTLIGSTRSRKVRPQS